MWHPRFGYVWLPEDVSPDWRPYTVGHWVSTEEYGWYWESNEPFAWAVYHYGRWGYDPDYGWFWVPGDTWAPAWVQWRYDDQYVGWAPIGPQRPGYAYGAPVGYEPPIAESWVFVPPRYMTSRAIPHYAVPIADLGVVFLGATRVYRPQFRGGVVYNYGVPRDYVVRITRRPIYVQKIYKVDSWKGGRYDKNHHGNGIRVYAPGVHKGDGHRGPKKFADHPDQFKPKAKLKHTFKGEPPKGFGRSAKDVKSIAKQDPDAFKRKHGKLGGQDDNDKEVKDKDKGRPTKTSSRATTRAKPTRMATTTTTRTRAKPTRVRTTTARTTARKSSAAPPRRTLPPPVVKDGTGGKDDQKGFSAERSQQVAKHGNRDATRATTTRTRTRTRELRRWRSPHPDRAGDGTARQRRHTNNKNKNKNQNFGGQNGQGGKAKAFDQNGGQGGGNNNNNKNKNKRQEFRRRQRTRRRRPGRLARRRPGWPTRPGQSVRRRRRRQQ